MDDRDRTWRRRRPDPDGWREIAKSNDLHPLAARLLARRGIDSADDARTFLDPRISRSMNDPSLLQDADRGAELAAAAVVEDDPIVVHGDYDADGLCGAAILVDFFETLGAEVDYEIPHRLEGSYGLDVETVERLAREGCELLVTVDCGVSARQPIERARELGLRTVVLDHHQPSSTLPPADALVDPLRDDCDYPFEGLAASGLALHFATATRRELADRGALDQRSTPEIGYAVDLVAVGTVADVVPLIDENRAFVRRGLQLVESGRRPGLAALAREACGGLDAVTAEDIAYQIAPRLNAAGRVGDASVCVELLTTESAARARTLARRLEAKNDERKALQADVLEEARRLASNRLSDDPPALVVHDEEWHRGVLGVVAGRLADRLRRPAVVLTEHDGRLEGSGRSPEAFDLVELLESTAERLERFGGHAAAAGLALEADELPAFREEFRRAADSSLETEQLPAATLAVDETIRLGELDEQFVRNLRAIAPFGQGNPEPRFVCERLTADESRIVGDDHLKATFEDGTGSFSGIGFSMGDRMELLDEPVSAAFTPKYSVFRGRERLELHLHDLKPAGSVELEP
ncbi:MAG: single-stranded-DNA-specific exonuclease RecJ [Bradymonadaceae bacterium]